MSSATHVQRFALYGEPPVTIVPEFVHIEPISQRSRIYDWTIAPHSHPCIFQLLLLRSGKGVLALDEEEIGLVPGAVVALPPGAVHAFRFTPESDGLVLSLAADLFADFRLAPFCSAASRPNARPKMLALDPEGAGFRRLSWLLDDIVSVLVQERGGDLADPLAARIVLLISLVANTNTVDRNATRMPIEGMREKLVDRFCKLIDLRFREGWSIDAYAKALGTSSPTLTRVCRLVRGKAPGEMISERLLLEAMRSLTYSTATVGQIADDLGFSDPAYFARFFRKRSGITASKFRTSKAWLKVAPQSVE